MTENEAAAIIRETTCTQCPYGYYCGKMNSCGNYECEKRNVVLEALKALESMNELWKYRAIGTIEECLEAIEKQTPKTPSHKYIKYGKHKWQRNEDGEIDDWAWDYEHCNPNYDELEDCEVNTYNCPSCNTNVYRNQNYCDCGQKLDWSNNK